MNMRNIYNNKLLNALYSLRSGAQLVANSICAFIGTFIFAGVFASFMFASSAVWAQGTPPAGTANCTVTAMNRTAPLQGDYGFTITGQTADLTARSKGTVYTSSNPLIVGSSDTEALHL